MRRSIRYTVPSLFVLVAACAHRPPRPESLSIPSSCRGVRSDVSVLTYNGAMAPGINTWATPRKPHVERAAASAPDDIKCFQEFWPYDVAMETVALLRRQGMEVFYEDTRGRNEAPGAHTCTQGDLVDIKSCMERSCANAGEETTVCAMQKCRSDMVPLYRYHRPCLVCLLSGVGMKKTEDIYSRCLDKGASRVYGGTSGIILASRWPMPIAEREVIHLSATGANRVALLAMVHPPGKMPIEVACTHLSAQDQVPPMYPGFDTWDDERRAQLKEIDERLHARAADRATIFAGDMNFGGNVSGWLRPISLPLWNEALTRGFTSPAADAWPPICSECGNNTFHPPGRNVLIDHVLLRNSAVKIPGNTLRPLCAEVVFHEKVVVSNGRKKRRMSMSDHNGIRVQFAVE